MNQLPLNRSSDAYRRAVASQIEQFPELASHALPPIFSYWSAKHLLPRMIAVLGGPQILSFAARIVRACDETGINSVLSVGAGDATQEIAIYQAIQALGREDITILALDLSPVLIEQANENIRGAGLQGRVLAVQRDLNLDFPQDIVAAVIVIDALHHMVELEGLFDNINRVLKRPGGVFLVRDMIGRNGHLRWPEVLGPLRTLWQRLPQRLKHRRQGDGIDQWFENFDCSTEGFEGVRAQDILKLLDERFSFETFLAHGSLVDIFTDRTFGPNLDPLREDDQAFIDSLQQVEDKLLAKGSICPTSMFAFLVHKDDSVSTKIWNDVSPAKAIRDPDAMFPPADLSGLLVPYEAEEIVTTPCRAGVGLPISFSKGAPGVNALRWGWHDPEPRHTWSYGEDSAIVLRIDDQVCQRDFTLTFGTYGYVTEAMGPQSLAIIVDDVQKATAVDTVDRPSATTSVDIGGSKNPNMMIRFRPSYVRNRDRDGGTDKRAIGFMIMNIAVT